MCCSNDVLLAEDLMLLLHPACVPPDFIRVLGRITHPLANGTTTAMAGSIFYPAGIARCRRFAFRLRLSS